jgi:hypothetical protein
MSTPEIDPRYYDLLKADILRRASGNRPGVVLVPLFRDQHGAIIDGHIRWRIIQELGLRESQYKWITVHVEDDQDRDELRVSLNLLRRHLTRAQQREAIRWAILRWPNWSDREIGRHVGAHHQTVGRGRRRASGEIIQSAPPPKRLPMITSAAAADHKHALEAMADPRVVQGLASGENKVRKGRGLKSRFDREDWLQAAGATVPEDFRLHHGDYRDLAATLPDECLDLAYCDPPWAAEDPWHGEFSAKEWAMTVTRLLKPGGFAAVYTGSARLPDWVNLLLEAGLTWRWLVNGVNVGGKEGKPKGHAHGPEGAGTIVRNGAVFDMSRPICLLQKSGPGVKFRTTNMIFSVLYAPDHLLVKVFDPWAQPESEAVALVTTLCPLGGVVGDLTFGSGTSATATARCGQGRKFMGAERREPMVRLAQSRIADALGLPQGLEGIPAFQPLLE